MPEQKLVSPLLDGFQMGPPISDHDGVRCCPAIKENSDNKYIVKILSIPASQARLDALLLTGAFQDAAGALNYFKDLTDEVVREIKLHQRLSRGGGFTPCEGWQVVPMDDNRLGYDVYVLTPYRRSLEHHLNKNTMTHLEAVNLGLDLCAALAASRRLEHLYVDLKPRNVFISDDKHYLIGDLGFVRLDSIQYVALPDKYRSCYSAPELHDIYATISSTADIYALGLVLYQVYNNGVLPFEGQPPAAELAAPANADEEMAEIILKACHPDPAQRWQDPTEMGQALVAYMQRNTINDVPILPPEEEEPQEEEPETEEEPQEASEETIEEPAESQEEPVQEEPTEEEASEEESDTPAQEEAQEDPQAEEEPQESEEETEPQEEAPAEDVAEPETSEEDEEAPADQGDVSEEPAQELESPESEEPAEEPVEEAPEEPTVEEPQEEEEEEEVLTEDPQAEEEPVETADEDTAKILAQADELAAHKVPDPVVVPEGKLPPEVPVEEPQEEPEISDIPDLPDLPPIGKPKKRRLKKVVVSLFTFLLLAALGFGGKYYYDNYYLIPVTSITLEGSADQITAQVVVDADESLLTAVCTDTYGNTATASVENGQAVFTGLKSGSQYTVSLTISSFNKLCGNNSATISTNRQTNVVSMSAITGPENGSVIISFTVDGTDPENWTVEYSADDQELKTLDFTGHMVTVTGLAMDTTYTFHIRPTIPTEVAVVGTNTIDFAVSEVILAQNIAIASFAEGTMDIRWDAPAGVEVAEWTVRCSDGQGFDQTITVPGCEAQFTGTEMGKSYTIEILAQGMTQSVRTELTPTELSLGEISCTPMGSSALRVTWEYQGNAPAEGWTVSYSINGGQTQTVTTQTNAADIRPLIPGAKYDVAVSDLTASYQAPAAETFADFGLTADQITGSFCKTPAEANWDHTNVTSYVKEFAAGQSLSMVVYINAIAEIASADVEVLYVIRDDQGNALPELCASQSLNWQTMWKDRYFYLTVPKAPGEAGAYTLELYFNGDSVLKKPFWVK